MLLVLVQGFALLLASLLLAQCTRHSSRKRTGGVDSQDGSPSTSEEPKSRKEPKKFTGRICRQSRLSNGIRVATEAFDATGAPDRAKITVSVGVGSRHEMEDINGIAHFTEHAILMGPEDSYLSFRQTYEWHRQNGDTDKEVTRFKMKCATQEDLEPAIARLALLLVNPPIHEHIVNSERFIIQQQCRENFDADKHRLLFLSRMVQRVAFHPNSLGLFTQGQEHTNASITSADIRRWYATHFKTNNTMIIAVGEVEHDEIVRWAEQYFKDFPIGDGVTAEAAVWRGDSRICLTPQAREVFGMLAVRGPPRTDFERNPLCLIVSLLWLIPYSMFPEHLQITADESGNVDEQTPWITEQFQDVTTIGRMFSAVPGKERAVVEKLIGEWRYLAYETTEEMLSLAKQWYADNLRRENLQETTDRILMDMRTCDRIIHREEYIDRCKAITLSEFRAACKNILLEGEFTIVAYGPPGTDLPTRDEMSEVLRRVKE